MDTSVIGQSRRKPSISISASDHARLTKLADSMAIGNALLADELFGELDRAKVVADDKIAKDVVRMGSKVHFADEKGAGRTVTLVFPGDADIAEGRLSILTPVGTALIGLSVGQSIQWTGRDGQEHRLTVQQVS